MIRKLGILVLLIVSCQYRGRAIQPAYANVEQSPAAVIAAGQLIERVLPQGSKRFSLELIPPDEGRDVFEIDYNHDNIVLRGNSSLTLATAFNWYLRHDAKINFDWEAVGPLKCEGQLPLPKVRIRQVCAAQQRFFLNYCTYGYTLPWWNWAQWQRFLDWMAMNGINRPLLQCGQEAVWLEVWESYGLREDQIRSYFCDPAHLPWHRMANLDKWGGPLPMSYIDGQKTLQIQILGRARSLGMKPILSGFAGHVPEALRNVKPAARITEIAPGWGGMDSRYATWFLDPNDPLFKEVQIRFLRKQNELYGSDHLYGADPFNEMSPPSWSPEYLASVAKSIYAGMAEADPDAVWYQMAWTFYIDHNWTSERLSAMTRAVPAGRMIYLDYVCEEVELYRKTENFFGAPFIWCYLANFGGNTQIVAPIHKLSARLSQTLSVTNCYGVGSTLEGLNVNPVAYDLLFEQPWHLDSTVNLKSWVDDYAPQRCGCADPAVIRAWNILADKVLLDSESGIMGHGIILQGIPPSGSNWTKPDFSYKQSNLVAALDEMLKADPNCRRADGYQFDLVNLTRQTLGNQSAIVYNRMMAAVKVNDLPEFRRNAALFLEIGRDLDTLLGSRHEFLLGRWLSDARAWGATPSEKLYYERYARQIITTWQTADGSLDDYANRQWNGLMKDYYLKRWEEFIKRQDAALVAGGPIDMAAYTQWRIAFENQWIAASGDEFPTSPKGDPYAISSGLFKKYAAELVAPASEAVIRLGKM